MDFTVNAQTQPVLPVDITLRLEQYCGCKLPTLYANNIPILHILDDGRICLRNGCDTNIEKLKEFGFIITPDGKQINVVSSNYLTRAKNETLY